MLAPIERKNKMEETIILIDKPKGITSFDVIRELRKKFKEAHPDKKLPKYGHAGTLDPLATGLMIVGVGGGTKKLQEYLKLPKKYRTEIILGIQTDTGDMEGKTINESEVPNIEKEVIGKVLKGLVGRIKLSVPAYSAIKRSGRPLYWYARRGEKIIPPVKEMEVKAITLLAVIRESTRLQLTIEMEVGSGTYVRSIAEEIGRQLGHPASVKELRRLTIGNFSVTDAQQL